MILSCSLVISARALSLSLRTSRQGSSGSGSSSGISSSGSSSESITFPFSSHWGEVWERRRFIGDEDGRGVCGESARPSTGEVGARLGPGSYRPRRYCNKLGQVAVAVRSTTGRDSIGVRTWPGSWGRASGGVSWLVPRQLPPREDGIAIERRAPLGYIFAHTGCKF